jgi:dynein heavy chain
MNKVSMGEA